MNVSQELVLIANKHGGLLRPTDIVAFARNQKTCLHSHFTWDDSKAGHEYRLWQARQIIRVNYSMLESDKGCQKIRIFYSLKSDRKQVGGGYRQSIDIMNNEDLSAELLAMAYDDMKYFKEKYKNLVEVHSVIQAMDEVLVKKSRAKKAV